MICSNEPANLLEQIRQLFHTAPITIMTILQSSNILLILEPTSIFSGIYPKLSFIQLKPKGISCILQDIPLTFYFFSIITMANHSLQLTLLRPSSAGTARKYKTGIFYRKSDFTGFYFAAKLRYYSCMNHIGKYCWL